MQEFIKKIIANKETSVDLSKITENEEMEILIKEAPQISEITLGGASCILSYMSSFPNLKTLHFNCVFVFSKEECDEIAKLQNLRTLDFNNCDLSENLFVAL